MKKRMKFFGIGAVVFIILLAAIPTIADDQPDIEEAMEFAFQEILPQEGFIGISYTEANVQNPEVIVYIENESYLEEVPMEIMGFQTKVIIIGEITAPPPPPSSPPPPPGGVWDRKGRVRPNIFGGISCGPTVIAFGGSVAGTLGIITNHGFLDPVILSCAHVIAMSRAGTYLLRGSAVLQPGTLDGGTRDDKVGELRNYIRLRFGLIGLIFPNYADAAIADLYGVATLDVVLGPDDTSLYGVDIDNPISVSVDNIVRKSGRTTGVTQNEVIDTHAAVKIRYGFLPRRYAYFKDQIFVDEPFISGGDSGSVVDKNGRFVGLAFAGSSYVGVVCKASYIKSGLGI